MTHPQFYKANYFFPLSASSGIGQFSDGVRISFITLSKPISCFWMQSYNMGMQSFCVDKKKYTQA